MNQEILDKEFILPKNGNSVNLVESIKDYISKHDCPNLSMDISNLNIIDASKVTVMCSTYHWAKYPEGKINLKISSKEIKDLVSPLTLGNIRLINAQ